MILNGYTPCLLRSDFPLLQYDIWHAASRTDSGTRREAEERVKNWVGRRECPRNRSAVSPEPSECRSKSSRRRIRAAACPAKIGPYGNRRKSGTPTADAKGAAADVLDIEMLQMMIEFLTPIVVLDNYFAQRRVQIGSEEP
jgi:hypothetical protein